MATDERRPTGQPTDSVGAGWSEVLAAVEADMLRVQQLIAASPEPAPSHDCAGAPAQAMLPVAFRQYSEATWSTLPAIEDMPPVPPELTTRIHDLRAQIVALQAEIKSEMTRWQTECVSRRAPSAVVTTAESYYVDRLA
jgi:hypothetical protein